MGHTTGRRHLRRLAAPKTWPIPRKGTVWVVKPNPGPHSIERSMPIALWIRDYLKYVKTLREVKYVLNKGYIYVDGRVIKDYKFPVGIFDILHIEKINKTFRVLINKRGKLYLKEIDENEKNIKPLKIIRKQYVKGGKIQLTLLDGRNIIVEDPKKYKVGDTLLIKVPEQEIIDHLPLESGNMIYIIGGKKVGEIGYVKEIIIRRLVTHNRILRYTDLEGNVKETVPEYAVVIGREKPVISI